MNREQREAAAALMEQFAARKFRTSEMERRWPRGDDLAVSEFRFFIWAAYDDEYVDWYEPNPQREELFRNCIDFLRTDLPYEWPVPNKLLMLLTTPLSIVTLGAAHRWLWRKYQFPDYWPFPGPRNAAADASD